MRRLACALLVAAALACDVEPELRSAEVPELGTPPAPLIGEGAVDAQPCEWPTVAYLSTGCTGVLVHLQVVLTTYFGPGASAGATRLER